MYGEATYGEVAYGAVPETLGVPIIPEVALVTTSLIFVVELDLILPQPPQPLLLTAQTRSFSLIAYPATLQTNDRTLVAETGNFTLTPIDAALTYTDVTFTPATLSGLQFWYDMTDSGTTVVSGLISQVNDLSGNSQHATQATASLRAAMLTNQFASRSGLDFTADRYACGTVTNSQAGTFFWAGFVDVVASQCFVGHGAQTNAVAGVALRALPEGTIQLVLGNGTARVGVDNTNYAAGQVLRCVARWDTTKLQLTINALTTSDLSHGLTGSRGTATVQLGSQTSGAQVNSLNGKIGAVGKYNRYLTDDEVDQMMTYLETLYPD